MNDKLEEIALKTKQVKLLKVLNILLASILSLVGVVSIVFLLMFFNEMYGLGYFYCFVNSIFLPFVYSCGVNVLLKPLDNKIKSNLYEINELENECKCEMLDNVKIDNIKLRFDGLSFERKKRLLNYVKGGITSVSDLEKKEEVDFTILLNNDSKDDGFDNKGCSYSRKRNIRKDIKSK